MSAEMLRRAAALMRERAEACGGTVVWESSIEGRDHSGGDDAILAGADDIYIHGGARRLDMTAHQDHIASWHPAVALAVADWLTYVADTHDETACPAMVAAEQVARAYLEVTP